MKFSIVTASYRQFGWLKRCVRSVADQKTVDPDLDIEHLIQDAGTGAELERWLGAHTQVRITVEQDGGIYDGLNRAFARATGDVFAFLNCDEQYLPGALRQVRDIFEQEPETDMVVGDCLIIDAGGRLLSFRRSTPLRASMILTDHLYDFTCAMFFRRSVWEKAGPFRTDFQAAGDAEWVSRALVHAPRIRYLRKYLAAFALTGENLSLRANRAREVRMLRAITPLWARFAGPFLRPFRHVEKLLAGGYRKRPIAYEIYTADEEERRTRMVSMRPMFRHPWA